MTDPFDPKTDERVQPALGGRVRAELEHVPPATADRLRAMRRTAVEELDTRASSPQHTWWVAGGLAASAASVALVTMLMLPAGPAVETTFPELDAEEIAVVQSMEVLEELEFLAWMEEEANRATAG